MTIQQNQHDTHYRHATFKDSLSVVRQARPLIFGEVLFDRFSDGTAIMGGAPFNVAWHLQAFGLMPLLISRIGTDEHGQKISDAMMRWGLDTTGLQRDPVRPTGSVEVQIIDQQAQYEIKIDQAWDAIDSQELPADLPNCSAIYHGTLAQRSTTSHRACRHLLSHCKVPVFVDVNLRSPWWEKQTALDLLQQATWLKLNQQELEALTASTGELEKQAQDLLAASDAEIVFVTLGGEGAKAWTKNGQQAIAQPMGDIAIVDTVGAGDAFSAVLMLGLAQQWPLQVMLDRAQAFATTIISLRGAISQDPILYQDVIEQWS